MKHRLFSLVLATVAASTVLNHQAYAQRLSSIRTDQNMEKGHKLGENYVDFYFLGFTNKNKALFIIDLVGKSYVYWVDPKTGRITKRQFQYYFAPDTARLSLKGDKIFAGESAYKIVNQPGVLHIPNILIIDSSDTLKHRSIYLGNSHINANIPNPLEQNKLVISLLEFTWDPQLKAYAGSHKRGSRYEIWDWKRGRKLGIIKDEYAGADRLFIGQKRNQRWLVGFYKYQQDYDYPAAFRPKGALAFRDIKNGQLVWRVLGNSSHTVGYPVAQLSPTQIVSQSTIFEYPAKRIRPLQVQGERVRLLGVVPGHPQKMIVATKRGAELWDYSRQQRLHRWAEIKDVDQILFSPDLKFFATQKYEKHLYTFYSFDPKLVK